MQSFGGFLFLRLLSATQKERFRMQIFNTLTRQKEEFVPQVPGEYRL